MVNNNSKRILSVALAAVVAAGSFAGFSFEAKASSAGISIDGDFSDWAGVAKYDIDEGKGYDTVNQLAAVWDSEYVYLYFHSNSWDWGAVTGAGGWNNGQYTLTSDLGRELLIQLSRDNNGSVAGVDGAMCAVNNTNWEEGHDWEVAVPVSALPENNGTFSFGTYLGQTVISGITNIDAVAGDTTLPDSSAGDVTGDGFIGTGVIEGTGESQVTPDNTIEGGNKVDTFIQSSSGMTYDGSYADWKGYAMTHIDYATGGTSAHVADGYGALFCDGSTLFGYGESSYEAHLNEAGGEFTQAITIRLNNNWGYCFYPRFVAVAADGSINWNPQLSGLSQGNHEFYIFDANYCWGTATNINALDENNICYGKMIVTVGASMDQMEFFMDMTKLANRFGIDNDRIETVSAQYGRIGQQWIGTAGTSTLPIVSVAIIVSCAAGYFVGKKRKAKEA